MSLLEGKMEVESECVVGGAATDAALCVHNQCGGVKVEHDAAAGRYLLQGVYEAFLGDCIREEEEEIVSSAAASQCENGSEVEVIVTCCGSEWSGAVGAGSYESHYAASHRLVCVECARAGGAGGQWTSPHLLNLHLTEAHGALAPTAASPTRPSSHRCSAKMQKYHCMVLGCPETLPSAAARKQHLIATHLYPPDFRPDPAHTARKHRHHDKPHSPSKSSRGRVPGEICFGRGSQKSFNTRPPGGGKPQTLSQQKQRKQRHADGERPRKGQVNDCVVKPMDVSSSTVD